MIATYFMYRISTSLSWTPLTPCSALSKTLSNSSTYLNLVGGEKLRKSEWLISAIPLNFNHLQGGRRRGPYLIVPPEKHGTSDGRQTKVT